MRGINRKRTLIVSAAIILLCLTIIVGMSFALFTDTATVTHHLQAGDLNITLKRVELLKTSLNDDGYLVTPSKPDTTVVDFTNPTNRNVFDITAAEKIVPKSKYTAKMEISNLSDVAFGYWIEIKCSDKTKGADLAKQINVTVTTDSTSSAVLNNGLTVGGPDAFIDEVIVGGRDTFTVSIAFSNGYNNDLAQGETLSFDIIVHAVQVTDAH